MVWSFFIGFIFGVIAVLLVIYIIICDPFGPKIDEPSFVDQFKPIEIPEQLHHFLKTGEDGFTASSWENTFAVTMLLHLLYQEHKDSRLLRRWLYKRLQLELNDITTRSAAGRLIQDIRIRDLSLGTKVPIINKIRVEKVEMSDDQSIFENAVFLIDIEYPGGFETSIDVQAMLGGYGSLSLKVTRLAGNVRLIISRKPYTHWAFSFEDTPEFEFEISSQIQGHRLRHVVPLIRDQIRRALQRKHVWPNYKIRYRPVFPNPLLLPSPPSSAYSHVKLVGGLEVAVLQCSRLKTSLVDKNLNYDVYCTVTLDQKPFLQSSDTSTPHSISVLLTFTRFDINGESGLSFVKIGRNSSNLIRVAKVESGSLADKAHFKKGDIIVAINSLSVRSERQVESLLRMKGDLSVLVERDLEEISENELHDGEEFLGDNTSRGQVQESRSAKDANNLPAKSLRSRSNSASSCSTRRHSLSILPASTSFTHDNTSFSQSAGSSMNDLKLVEILQDRPANPSANVSRTESARVPHVLVSTPSIDLRRTRSESQIDNKHVAKAFHNLEPKSIEEMFDSSAQSLCEPHMSQSSLECAESLNVTKDDDKKINTLKAGTIPLATSQSSLASALSFQSSNFDDSIHNGSSTRLEPEKSQSRRARIHTALAAGKKRMFDLMPQKKRSSVIIDNVESVELGLEAGELQLLSDGEKQSRTSSPTPTTSRLPAECIVKDQENDSSLNDNEARDKAKYGLLGRKKKGSPTTPHKLSTTGSALNLGADNTNSASTSTACLHSRSTRTTHLEPNVLWGQSLHFEMNEKVLPVKRYLNLTVHARENQTANLQSTGNPKDPARPILLGYTSLYLPQIIDDCRLTLSNCHREVFQLKAPNGPSDTPNSNEFSKHPGFDPRLMFGDVTLNFRYFPDGLPAEARIGLNDSSDDEQHVKHGLSLEGSQKLEQLEHEKNELQNHHDWKPWSAKQSATCSICKGKIWLKTGLCCSRCFVVCHLKCQDRETAGVSCSPNAFTKNDDNFEDISSVVLPSTSKGADVIVDEESERTSDLVERVPPESKIPALDSTKKPYQSETEIVSRRTKFKAKMSEKIGQLSWRRRKEQPDDPSKKQGITNKNEMEAPSPMASIASCLSDFLPQLEGSPFLTAIYFEPGNAYNEETIANAKRLGKEIFSELPIPERHQRINDQIDRIQTAIHETKTGRLEAMSGQSSNESQIEKSSLQQQTFEGLDERLQALAVLMLHYCAALQDCCEQEENEQKMNLVQAELVGENSESSVEEKEASSST